MRIPAIPGHLANVGALPQKYASMASMYMVESDKMTRYTTNRRAAWTIARQEAKDTGWADLYDGLCIEPPIYFELDGGKVHVCHCTAEERLLRAIFNDPHPAACSYGVNA